MTSFLLMTQIVIQIESKIVVYDTTKKHKKKICWIYYITKICFLFVHNRWQRRRENTVEINFEEKISFGCSNFENLKVVTNIIASNKARQRSEKENVIIMER